MPFGVVYHHVSMRILVPIDDSPQAEKALVHALETYPDAEFTALYVLDPIGHWSDGAPFPTRLGDWYAELEERAVDIFDRAGTLAAERGIDLQTETRTGEPDRAIVEYATDEPFDAIVIGSHGRHGLSRVVLGSVAEAVVRRSPIPVTVVR